MVFLRVFISSRAWISRIDSFPSKFTVIRLERSHKFDRLNLGFFESIFVAVEKTLTYDGGMEDVFVFTSRRNQEIGSVNAAKEGRQGRSADLIQTSKPCFSLLAGPPDSGLAESDPDVCMCV